MTTTTSSAPDGRRPRPVLAAAARQAPLVAAGSLLPGPGYLAALTTAGVPIGRWDVLIALGLSLLPTVLQLLAQRRIVTDVEQVVTPTASPRNDAGQVLRPRDAQLLDQALDELAARRAADTPAPAAAEAAAGDEPAGQHRRGPEGTSRFPPVGSARSMLVPGTERQRTAPPAGSPSSDPPPYTGTVGSYREPSR